MAKAVYIGGSASSAWTGQGWYDITYGNEKFVTVAYNSTKAAYSSDGINWVETTLPSSAYWYIVAART
jgi:hypothetical protein